MHFSIILICIMLCLIAEMMLGLWRLLLREMFVVERAFFLFCFWGGGERGRERGREREERRG